MLNRKFVPSGPQHPTHGRKPKPKDTLNLPREAPGQDPQLMKRERSPLNVHNGANASPENRSQVASKKDMVSVLKTITKVTQIRARAILHLNLIGRWKFAPNGLPHEIFHLKWHPSRPDGMISGGSRSMDKFRIQLFDREFPKRRVGPGHGVLSLREQRETSIKSMSVSQLYKRQGVPKTQISSSPGELQDGDLRIGAVSAFPSSRVKDMDRPPALKSRIDFDSSLIP